jgi:hypothetical protein
VSEMLSNNSINNRNEIFAVIDGWEYQSWHLFSLV